jgi:deoxyadenosine/deoxycytidine kinase
MVARTHLAICASQNSVIQDRSICEDAHIFARALHDMKMLSLRDYRAYRELYDLVIETLPPPDLLVYLQASVPTLMERIGHGTHLQIISKRILDKLQGKEEVVFPKM